MDKYDDSVAQINGFSLSYTSLFSAFKINGLCHISVVIPVRNEAENILQTLEALARQVDSKGKPINFCSFEILILANNCTDNSVHIIRKFQKENPFIPLYLAEIFLPDKHANIGFVRRLLMNEAFNRLRSSAFGEGVIMTTDSDTVVADNWIMSNLMEIAAGADAVGGRIIIDRQQLKKMDPLCKKIHLKDEKYRLLIARLEALIDDLPFDYMPRHHQHFNASFAVTTKIFEKAGGVPDVKFLEDCAFYERLQKIDANVRHSPNVKVYTSSRHVGRCEVGLSFQLNAWKSLKQCGKEILVESAESTIMRLTIKKNLRKIWNAFFRKGTINLEDLESISEQTLLPKQLILGQLNKKETFGIFYSEIDKMVSAKCEWENRYPKVSLDIAVDRLKNEINQREGLIFLPDINTIMISS